MRGKIGLFYIRVKGEGQSRGWGLVQQHCRNLTAFTESSIYSSLDPDTLILTPDPETKIPHPKIYKLNPKLVLQDTMPARLDGHHRTPWGL